MANLAIQWKPRIMYRDDDAWADVVYPNPGSMLCPENWTLIESVELQPRIRAPLSSVLYLGTGETYKWSCWLSQLLSYPGVYPALLYVPPRQNVLSVIREFPTRIGPPWVAKEFEQTPPDLILRYSLTEPPPSLIC